MEEYTFLAPFCSLSGTHYRKYWNPCSNTAACPTRWGCCHWNHFRSHEPYRRFQSLPELHDAVSSVANINPDLILYLFLPILIFRCSLRTQPAHFQEDIGQRHPVGGTGTHHLYVAHGRPHDGSSNLHPRFWIVDMGICTDVRALISATDPVAVVALLHELKTSKRFSTLVDAESLLNDGTNRLLHAFFQSIRRRRNYSCLSCHYVYPWSGPPGTLLGFLLARIVIWFITRINSEEMVQNSVIILAGLPFHSLPILSQRIGVIALVAFGLTVTYVEKPGWNRRWIRSWSISGNCWPT